MERFGNDPFSSECVIDNLNVYPAKEWTAFEYSLSIASYESNIVISDSKGQQIESIELTGNMGVFIWDTREIEPRVYFYILKNNITSKSGKVVITK
jgi:hypothetical protein